MRPDLARALAAAFLTGEWSRQALIASGFQVVQGRPRWLRSVVTEVLQLYPRPPLDRPRELAAVIRRQPAATKAGSTRPIRQPIVPTRMLHNPWGLVALHDLSDVMSLLRLDAGELAWFSDPRHWARRADMATLQHYRVGSRVAASGAVRVLEAPKPRLKAIQRRLLNQIVGRIPAHDAAHGFRRGRSVASYTAPHAGRAVVVRLDLEGFFASVTVGRVYGTLRTAGYPEPVAHCLAGLMTSIVPLRAWQTIPKPSSPRLLGAHWRLGRHLAAPHLPQGAPTSPALANLAAFHLDVRLSALAQSWGARYTRYADDLAFSAGRSWRVGTSRVLDLIGQIVREEGFRLNDRKTAVLPRAGRQLLGGLVVNEAPRVSRGEVDLLRAILHNCARHGPRSQNREGRPDFAGYLRGRVGWVAQHDPARGARLRAELDAIDWDR